VHTYGQTNKIHAYACGPYSVEVNTVSSL